MTWLKHFQAVFGLGDDSRVADLEAWIVRGDEGAFARLGGRAAKKKADWHNLGAHGFFELKDPLTRMRALKLVRTVRDGEALVAWLARDADSAWLTAYLTARSVELKQAPPERITGWQPHLRKQSALLQFLRSIESTDPLFGAVFRDLDKGIFASLAAELLAELGCERREDGIFPQLREVRWFGPVVVVRVRMKPAQCHVFASTAEANAFVAHLPPIEARPKRSKPTLVPTSSFVAIWLDTVLDPKGDDGKGGPVGWFDHDSLEAEAGELSALLPGFSYGASFAAAALDAAAKLGVSGERYVSLLYDHVYTAEAGPMKSGGGWFLGSFPFQRA